LAEESVAHETLSQVTLGLEPAMIHALLVLALVAAGNTQPATASATVTRSSGSSSADAKPLEKPGEAKKPAVQADAAQVKAALLDLDRAFKDGDKFARVKAIGAAATFVDAGVVESIAKGLHDKESDVQKAAIEALRFLDHPGATKSLIDCARHDTRIKKDIELYAALMRAIGQHGEAAALDVLTDEIWTTLEHPVIQARLLSIGRIRSIAAVEKLFDLLKSAGPGRVQPYMENFRMSLMLLTGADEGASPEAWMRWWNENKTRLQVQPKAQALPKHLQYLWDSYWGEATANERPRKKAERGKDDPEK
jgi:hypothetical protein